MQLRFLHYSRPGGSRSASERDSLALPYVSPESRILPARRRATTRALAPSPASSRDRSSRAPCRLCVQEAHARHGARVDGHRRCCPQVSPRTSGNLRGCAHRRASTVPPTDRSDAPPRPILGRAPSPLAGERAVRARAARAVRSGSLAVASACHAVGPLLLSPLASGAHSGWAAQHVAQTGPASALPGLLIAPGRWRAVMALVGYPKMHAEADAPFARTGPGWLRT